MEAVTIVGIGIPLVTVFGLIVWGFTLRVKEFNRKAALIQQQLRTLQLRRRR